MHSLISDRIWKGPFDEEGKPHGRGKMYELTQDVDVIHRNCTTEEYYADGSFDSAGRFIPNQPSHRYVPKGEAYEVLVFDGIYEHGEQVIAGSIRWAAGYRYESIDNSERMRIFKGDTKVFEGSILPFPFPMNSCADAIEGKKFYPDGVVEFEGEFMQRGLRFKKGTSYYPDGTRRYTGEFSPSLTDQPHGSGTLWYPNGNLCFEGEFYHGRAEKGIAYKEDGSLWEAWTKYDMPEYKAKL